MRFFGRKTQLDDESSWGAIVYTAQLNTLSLGYMLLTLLDNPEAVNETFRAQLKDMIRDLEDGLSRFEEFLV